MQRPGTRTEWSWLVAGDDERLTGRADPANEARFEAAELRIDMRRHLTRRQREIVVRHFAGYDEEEIAAAMCLSRSTVQRERRAVREIIFRNS